MQNLTHTLYVISNLMLVPVTIVLLVMLAWTLWLFGGFVREMAERKGVRRRLIASLAAVRHDQPQALWEEFRRAQVGLPYRFAQLVPDNPTRDSAVLTKALSDLEHDIAESIARHSFITRIGPMLGLMGTLIPLGPALTGLAAGNVQVLASNLVIAFTATVVGLFISATAYGMALARRTWYARDFSDLELVCQQLSGKEL